MKDSLRTYLFTWLALLALLATTVGSSFIPLGRMNLAANLVIAAAKAALVVIVFMQLRRHSATARLVAIGGLAWLALLAVLAGGADFAVR